MPTLNDNKKTFDGAYQWMHRGDEWSASWGGPVMQWYGTILPRIHAFVPTGTILEIACGYGRWTQFLKDRCEHLAVIDLSCECIEACRKRFAGCSTIEYHVNDGKSLDMIPDASVDLIFSFDSLVHADASVLQQYIAQFPRILKPEGGVFLHHSNLGEYYTIYSKFRKIPGLGRVLKALGILEKNLHWRDASVTAGIVESLAQEHGLQCISQEIIPWERTRATIDCMSVMVKKGSPLAGANCIVRNTAFKNEVRSLKTLSQIYSVEHK